MGMLDRAPFSFCMRCCGRKKDAHNNSIEKATSPSPGPHDGTRVQWSSSTEFLLTCIGYSVGLGNVWRFPYLCYKMGGGAFLLPYVIMMVLIGMPLLFMEYGIGQYFGIGSLSIFKRVCPMFQGVGIGYCVLNGLVCIYYNVIIAIALYYLFASFTANLPWADPENSQEVKDDTLNITYHNSTTLLPTTLLPTTLSSENYTSLPKVLASDRYFRSDLMDMRDWHNIGNLGEIRWRLCLCLLLAWILVVIFVSRGIKSTGKVAYFTATFPYVMLTVLVVRGVTMDGASKGIMYFITPDFERLGDPEVWFTAASQLFYSTNLAWGGMITMASYNQYNHNFYRDALTINLVSFFTSLYASFAVFSIIGYMSHHSGEAVKDVIKSGPGLAFVTYPRALSMMPIAPMWSALFFFMLFLLGIGSQMVLVENIMSGLTDSFRLKPRLRFAGLVATSCVCFCWGLPQVTQGGMYVLELMDHYSASFSVLIIAVVECFVINWVYGTRQFAANVKDMLGAYPGLWWRVSWKFISPAVIIFILIFSFVQYRPVRYGNILYPVWADALGWILVLAAVCPIFIVAIISYARAPGSTLRAKWLEATKPQQMPKSIEIDNFNQKIELNIGDEADGITPAVSLFYKQTNVDDIGDEADCATLPVLLLSKQTNVDSMLPNDSSSKV